MREQRSCRGVLTRCGFAQQIGEKAQIRNQHSPIANLEHPSALSLAIRRAAKLLIRLIVQGCSKLAIGECWLRISDRVRPARFIVQSTPVKCITSWWRGEQLAGASKQLTPKTRSLRVGRT